MQRNNDELITLAKQAFESGHPDVLVVAPIDDYCNRKIKVDFMDEQFTVNEACYNAALKILDTLDFFEVVVGYGSGGAVALVAAALHLLIKCQAIDVCTFGSPGVGCARFNQIARKLNYMRVRHSSDYVPLDGFTFHQPCPAVHIGHGSVCCIMKIVVRVLAHLDCNIGGGSTLVEYLSAINDIELALL